MKFYRIKILLIILSVFGFTDCYNVNAQRVDKYYTSLGTETGKLYFIYPIKGFITPDKNKFIYDITFLSETDSVILIFSYFDKRNLNIDSIIFINDNSIILSNAEIIFVEANKAKLHYRYTVNLDFNEIKNFFYGDNPLIKLIAKQAKVEVGMRGRTWKRHSRIIQRIFTIIELNK